MLSPEKAHHFTVALFNLLLAVPGGKFLVRKVFQIQDPKLNKRLFGLNFPNPVGLAAGFDKDGKYMHAMGHLGFGFLEIGTVTPKPQVGNPRPRLFRIPSDKALINRMGFNNEGVEAMVARLKAGKPKGVIIGGNIGKNKITPNEQAFDDYALCFDALFPLVDYFVVNVSSPNTPNLRALQDKEPLTQLLNGLQEMNRQHNQPKPVLLKIAPDLSDTQLDDILEIVRQTGIDGLIATNTTIDRSSLSISQEQIEAIGNGGLSGAVLEERSTEVVRYLHKKSNGQVPIIAVGGVNSVESALKKLEAGASLVQIYTGLIYEGPMLIKKINKAILNSY